MFSNSGLHHSRRGFTLLEMLIVIAIIGILMSLSILVMNGMTDQALRESTKATIQKINGLVQQRIESFDRAFTGDRREIAIQRTLLILNAGIQAQVGRPVPLDTLEAEPAVAILAKKDEFRYQFPQRVEDRLSRDVNTGGGQTIAGLPESVYDTIAYPVARTQLIEGGNPTPTKAQIDTRVTTNWGNHDRDTESSELLYFALVRSESFGATNAGADEFSGTEVADTDNDGLPEFVDAWGNPLRFYRWPTRLIDWDSPVPFDPLLAIPNDNTDTRVISDDERRVAGSLLKGLPPAPGTISGTLQRDFLLVDPDDPFGLIYSLLENPEYLAFGIDLGNIINEDSFHTIDTYHTPMIVSAGVDEDFGLYEPWRTQTGILGILAQPAGTDFNSAMYTPTQAVEDAMLDNVTNRNRRSGGQR